MLVISDLSVRIAGRLLIDDASVRIPDAACQVALLPAYEPWMTGALVYCDPFWALDAVGLRDPLLAQWETP